MNNDKLNKYLRTLSRKYNIDIRNLDHKQLIAGFKVEQEHNQGDDVDVVKTDVDALKIAIAHIREVPDYYTKLQKVEPKNTKVKENVTADGNKKYWGNVAGGILAYCPSTDRFLLNLRSQYVNEPLTYGIFGGKAEEGENIKEVVSREFNEETGFVGKMKIKELYIFNDSKYKFKYYNFLGIVDTEFKPQLDWESAGYKWVTFDEMKTIKNLHFGMKELLNNVDLKAETENLSDDVITEADDSETLDSGFIKAMKKTNKKNEISVVGGIAGSIKPLGEKNNKRLTKIEKNSIIDTVEIDDSQNEISYDSNLGFHEMILFYQKASDKQVDLLDQLLKSNKYQLAWKLVEKVVGYKLHRKH